MKEFLESLEECLETKNWYGALFTALTLPDICGKIDGIHEHSRARYSAWFTEFVQDKYTHQIGRDNEPSIFLSGNDCYALRCAFLHEGQEDISGQRAQEVVERFHFIAPINGMLIHSNMMNNKLQLQIDIFCRDILNGVKEWLGGIDESDPRHNHLNGLLSIQLPNPDGSIRI